MVQRVWGVRHGQSTWNAEHRIQGQAAEPILTTQGRSQAAHAGAHLVGCLPLGPVAVACSDLPRAVETAGIIVGVVGARRVVGVSVTPALREQCVGALEGARVAELGECSVPSGVHFSDYRWGGGESLSDVYERVSVGLPSVVTNLVGGRAGVAVVVVSHGDTLRALTAWSLGVRPRDIGWDPWKNGETRLLTLPM